MTTGRRIAERLAPSLGLEIFLPPFALKLFTVRMVWHPRSEEDSVAALESVVHTAVSRLLEFEKTKRPPTRRGQEPKAPRGVAALRRHPKT